MPSINDFKQSFDGDLARANRFLVFVPVPLKLLSEEFDVSRKLVYRCENAQLPGKTLATTEQRIYGPIEKHPYLATYNDIDLTFIVDDSMEQKAFFEDWLAYINPLSSNDFRYRQEYETTITINQYTVTDNLSYSVNLYHAYPISMNQLDLDWNNEGYHKLTVTFAYSYWTSTKTGNVTVRAPVPVSNESNTQIEEERILTGY